VGNEEEEEEWMKQRTSLQEGPQVGNNAIDLFTEWVYNRLIKTFLFWAFHFRTH